MLYNTFKSLTDQISDNQTATRAVETLYKACADAGNCLNGISPVQAAQLVVNAQHIGVSNSTIDGWIDEIVQSGASLESYQDTCEHVMGYRWPYKPSDGSKAFNAMQSHPNGAKLIRAFADAKEKKAKPGVTNKRSNVNLSKLKLV